MLMARKHFGYTTYWVNRFSLPVEKLGTTPDGTSTNIDGLLRYVLPEVQTRGLSAEHGTPRIVTED